MKLFSRLFSVLLVIFFAAPLAGGEGKIAKANGINLWYETFGNQDDPALLLIMGGNCQGVLWPVEFCEQLAREGFYVIRYDHRDTGLSTCFNFAKNPYDLIDISKDAVGLLDFLDVKKTHLFGISMGALVAEVMAARFPDRVHTIAIMASTSDVRPMNLALSGKPSETSLVSSPSEHYLSWVEQFFQSGSTTVEEHLEQQVAIWHLLSGSVAPFDKGLYYSLFRESLSRLQRPDVQQNHFLASALSEDLVLEVPYQIQVPTLILQGSEDPVFRPDHGEALSKAIKGSKYLLVEGMGHVPNSSFDNFLIKQIKLHASAR
jgi:pimeloyl-ACP methyl ester carboxylesterase